MKISILAMFLSFSCVIADTEPFETEFDLSLGVGGAPGSILAVISEINTAVVFQRLAHTAMCPSGKGGEFALKKVNAAIGRTATFEHISSICTIIDSIAIDTVSVYEIPTGDGKNYYMRLRERVGTKVKAQIYPTLPDKVVPSSPQQPPIFQDQFARFPAALAKINEEAFVMLGPTAGIPIVLRVLPYPTICPVTRYLDFGLKKSAADPARRPISIRMNGTCSSQEWIDIDSSLIYEGFTAYGQHYYMRLLELDGPDLRVRFTSEKPVGLAGWRVNPSRGRSGIGSIYRPDGRSIPSSGPGSVPEFLLRRDQ